MNPSSKRIAPGRSRRIDGHFYPSAPEMPGICQSQASISEYFGKTFRSADVGYIHLRILKINHFLCRTHVQQIENAPGCSRRIDGHFYPSAPEMPGICQSQAGISEYFGKTFRYSPCIQKHSHGNIKEVYNLYANRIKSACLLTAESRGL